MLATYARMLDRDNAIEAAIKQYRRLIALEPHQQRSHLKKIVEMEIRSKRLDGAKGSSEELIRIAPRDPDAMLLRAAVAMNRGNRDRQLRYIRKAVQLAPADVEIRSQLVIALRDAKKLKEAILQAHQCFELAESISEKKSHLSFIAKWSRTEKDQKELIRRVRQARLRHANPAELDSCVVHVLDLTGHHHEASQELIAQHHRRPKDIEKLTQIVAYAESHRDGPTAVLFQEKLVQLTDRVTDREKLARLYRQNGRIKRCQPNLESTGRSTGDRQRARAVDRCSCEGSRFTIRGTTGGIRFGPSSTGLANRLSSWRCLHGFEQADGQRCLSPSLIRDEIQPLPLPVTTPPATLANQFQMPQAMQHYHELTQGVSAFSEVTGFHRLAAQLHRSLAPLSRRTRTSRFRAPRFQLAMRAPTDPYSARLRSAIAVVAVTPPHEDAPNWLKEVATNSKHVPDLKMALVACWITNRSADIPSITNKLQRLAPQEPLPHVTTILINAVKSLESGNNEGEILHQMRASYQWLKQNQPPIADDIRQLYISHLSRVPDVRTIDPIVKDEIKNSKSFSEITALINLLPSEQGTENRKRFVEKAHQLLLAQPESILQEDLSQVLNATALEMKHDESAIAKTLDMIGAYLDLPPQSNRVTSTRLPIVSAGAWLLLQQFYQAQMSMYVIHRNQRGLTQAQSRSPATAIPPIDPTNESTYFAKISRYRSNAINAFSSGKAGKFAEPHRGRQFRFSLPNVDLEGASLIRAGSCPSKTCRNQSSRCT